MSTKSCQLYSKDRTAYRRLMISNFDQTRTKMCDKHDNFNKLISNNNLVLLGKQYCIDLR